MTRYGRRTCGQLQLAVCFSVLTMLGASSTVFGQEEFETAWADSTLAEGRQLFGDGQYLEAAAVFGEVAAVDPSYGDAAIWQKISFIRTDRLEVGEALASVAEVLEGMNGAALRSDLGQEVMELTRELTERRDRGGSAARKTNTPDAADVDPGATSESARQGQDDAEDGGRGSAKGTSSGAASAGADAEPQPAESAVLEGEVVEIAEVSRPPKALRMNRPKYPPVARQRRVRGEYRAQMLIGPDGKVEQIRVVSVPQAGLGFEGSVEQAAESWLFSPAVVDGIPVRTWMPIRIPFGE